MKLNKFFTGVAVVASALGMSSCSEDFEVAAPYKDVTIVYGMLNVNDTAQYIRIQKTFMDENRSAVDLAKISDSSYYPEQDLEVHMKALNSNGEAVNDDILNRVDLANENLPKQPGVFFQTPSYAYKYTRALNTNLTYRLLVKHLKTGEADSATSNIINTNPGPGTGTFFISFFSTIASKLSFPNANVDNKFRMNVGVPTNAKYIEGFIRFKYASLNTVTGIQSDSSFIWNFASEPYINTASSSVTLTVDRSAFYSVVNANIKTAPSNIIRYLDSADVFVWAANEDFYTYMISNNAQGGITADQIKTSYTNIKGKEVLGLFASRAMRIRNNIPFDQITLDSIKRNNLTKDLNFAGFADH